MSNQSVSNKYRSALKKARAKFPDFDELPTVDLVSFANTPATAKDERKVCKKL